MNEKNSNSLNSCKFMTENEKCLWNPSLHLHCASFPAVISLLLYFCTECKFALDNSNNCKNVLKNVNVSMCQFRDYTEILLGCSNCLPPISVRILAENFRSSKIQKKKKSSHDRSIQWDIYQTFKLVLKQVIQAHLKCYKTKHNADQIFCSPKHNSSDLLLNQRSF